MSIIEVNGKKFRIDSSAKDISIVNGKVFVDGKALDDNQNTSKVEILVKGNIKNLQVDSCQTIKVDGVVEDLKSGSGDVKVIGSVGGSVRTGSGDVECTDIHSYVQTGSGDVNASVIKGSVQTGSGDIKHHSV